MGEGAVGIPVSVVVVGKGEIEVPWFILLLSNLEADVTFPVPPIVPSQTIRHDSVLKDFGTWSQK